MAKGFEQAFAALTGHARPLGWQQRLYARLVAGEVPEALDLPTGMGKTSVMALWLLALAMQMRAGGQPRLPRRLVYVVDRRAVVDQATTEAEKLQKALDGQPGLGWMRTAFGLAQDEALPVSTLRGQLADNRAWLVDPARPAIIIGTVDMVGSRLLFSGYGVSRRERPYMAGLLGVDALFVLDESHLVPPFERLLEQIARADERLWPEQEVVRPLKVLPLSATGRERERAFRLDVSDEEDAVVRRRLRAPKRLVLERIALQGSGKALEKALAEALAERAWAQAFDADGLRRQVERRGNGGEGAGARLRAVRALVYVNSRQVAQLVAELLRKRAAGEKRSDPPRAQVELFTGVRRVMERQQAAERLRELGFLAGHQEPSEEKDTPAFLVATSAAEVGVDLDADVMIGDLVPLERMIQRFGRVNRLGALAECSITVLVDENELAREKDEARRQRLQAVVRALEKLDGDASPAALMKLKEEHPALVEQASTPPPLHPPLELPTVEAWAMTSLPEHTGRPDIQPWLRGWVQEESQAIIIWRQYLPWRRERDGSLRAPLKAEVEAFFRATPPHLLERLEAPAGVLADVLISRARSWKKQFDEQVAAHNDEADGQHGADAQPALLALSPAGEFRRGWTLEQLAAEKGSTLTPTIAGCLLVAARELGGLASSGLLDKKASEAPDTLDAGWSEEWQQVIGYRVRLARPATLETGLTEEEARSKAGQAKQADEGAFGPWREEHVLVLERDGHDEPKSWLVVEVLRSHDRQEGDPAIARIDYGLKPHLEDVAREARQLAESLHLPQRWQELLRLSGQWHDVGKNRAVWQLAASAKVGNLLRQGQKLAMDTAFAKTTGPFRPRLLGGYRHEFGSLLDALDDAALRALPEAERDIILHLVAAHHGGARPLINAVDPMHPPSRLQQVAAETALRFARLQRRFGPWGLAWLEALLRAADRKASAMLNALPGTRMRSAVASAGGQANG